MSSCDLNVNNVSPVEIWFVNIESEKPPYVSVQPGEALRIKQVNGYTGNNVKNNNNNLRSLYEPVIDLSISTFNNTVAQ